MQDQSMQMMLQAVPPCTKYVCCNESSMKHKHTMQTDKRHTPCRSTRDTHIPYSFSYIHTSNLIASIALHYNLSPPCKAQATSRYLRISRCLPHSSATSPLAFRFHLSVCQLERLCGTCGSKHSTHFQCHTKDHFALKVVAKSSTAILLARVRVIHPYTCILHVHTQAHTHIPASHVLPHSHHVLAVKNCTHPLGQATRGNGLGTLPLINRLG